MLFLPDFIFTHRLSSAFRGSIENWLEEEIRICNLAVQEAADSRTEERRAKVTRVSNNYRATWYRIYVYIYICMYILYVQGSSLVWNNWRAESHSDRCKTDYCKFFCKLIHHGRFQFVILNRDLHFFDIMKIHFNWEKMWVEIMCNVYEIIRMIVF